MRKKEGGRGEKIAFIIILLFSILFLTYFFYKNQIYFGPPAGQCGNGVVDSGEQCDLGSNNGGQGKYCSSTCKTVDSNYLLNVNVSIFNKGLNDSNKTFTVTYQGAYLRQNFSGEAFWKNNTGGLYSPLKIQYDIIKKVGGVDVVYTLYNPTPINQEIPEFRIEGIKQSNNSNDNLQYLKPKGSVGFVAINWTQTNFIDRLYPTDYYSPVIVSQDNNFVTGSAIQYPYLQYRHNVRSTLTLVNSPNSPNYGTWSHRYRDFQDNIFDGPDTKAVIKPGATEKYTISLRFASPRNWIFTLSPYKDFFNQAFGEDARSVQFRNRLAVRGVQLGDGSATSNENVRGYRGLNGESVGRIDQNGWGPFTDWFINQSKTLGYKRVMIWLPGGAYKNNLQNNFPPQFMSDWLPNASNSDGNFSKYKAVGIELGFWWGRSTQIPSPVEWDAATLYEANLEKIEHREFLNREIQYAKNRSAVAIGLDQFTRMPVYQRFVWIEGMKALAPPIKTYMHESSGPDLLHRKIANYAEPEIYGNIPGPDLLAWYLNPGSEIYVEGSAHYGNTDFFKSMSQWGYTPLPKDISLNAEPISPANNPLVQCFNGKDDDGDGLVDIFDLGCSYPADNSESG